MTTRMIRAYVAGPYRADTDAERYQNIQTAREVSEYLWSLGYNVYCPHLNSAWMSGVCPEENFIRAGLDEVERSDLIVLTAQDAPYVSSGTSGECDKAQDLDIPIVTDWQFTPSPDEFRRGAVERAGRCDA